MQNMTEREFVSKVYTDKKYMVEVFGHIPDEVVKEQAQRGKEQQGQEADLGPEMARFLVPAAADMGFDFDPNVLASEADAQVRAMSSFGKITFLVRFVTALKKAGKSGR